MESRRLLAAGDLDLSFSGDGKATLNLGGGLTLRSTDVAVQTDGKTLVVGTLLDGNVSPARNEFAVARLNLNGTPDITFGPNGNGVVRTRIGPGIALASAVAIAPGGTIVVVGTADYDEVGINELEFAVARYLPSGQLDSSFGSGGIRQIEISDGVLGGNGAAAHDVAIQSDGKIVVVGGADNHGDDDFAIACLNTNGSLDGSFDDDGKKHVGFGENEGAYAVAIDYSGTPSTNPLYGTIVLAGDSSNSGGSVQSVVAVARVNSNGSMAAFGNDGRVTYAHPNMSQSRARDLLVQSGGKIVIAGYVDPGSGSNDFLLARFNTNGTLDTSFGGAGTGARRDDFGTGLDRATGIITSYADTRLIVGGFSRLGTVERFAMAKYTADGVLDTTFGAGTGKVLTPLLQAGTGPVINVGIAQGPGRRFVVTGGDAMETARYLDAGANLVTIGTFNPYFSEPSGSTSFIVGRTEVLPTPQRVFLNVSGTARRPGAFPIMQPSDYTGSNITFGRELTIEPTFVDIPAGQSFTNVIITARDDTLVEGDETAIFTIAPQSSYEVGTPGSTTLILRDDETTGGPMVASSSYQFESMPQRLRFRFSQDVVDSISAADFEVTGPPGLPPFTFNYDQSTLTATLSYASILPDGNYSARAIAAGISNTAGTPMSADHLLSFFVLAGDATRDGIINLDDFNVLAANFGQTNRTFSQGDFNYDGIVNLTDFNILAARFGTTLAGPREAGTARGGTDGDEPPGGLRDLLA